MRVLKIAPLYYNTRDIRELSVYQELGEEIIVMASNNTKHLLSLDKRNRFIVSYLDYRYSWRFIPKIIKQIIAIFRWAYYARKIKSDVISGRDIQGLLIGWLSTFFSKKKPLLIYDAHEFELGRSTMREKSYFKKNIVKLVEKKLIKRCSFTIVVNDWVANELQRIYCLRQRPIVVRNIPNIFPVDTNVCMKTRETILKELCVDDNKFLLMYHGMIMRERNIEALIQIAQMNENVAVIILGNLNEKDDYISELKCFATNLKVSDRVLFHSAVSFEELWKYVGAVDCGMILATAKIKNTLYSLPNKFFENIQSETPVICPHYPAMKALVDKYKIGLTCDPTQIDEINVCVEKMRTDKDFYQQCKANLKKAKEELCWEKEKEIVKEVYLEYIKQ